MWRLVEGKPTCIPRNSIVVLTGFGFQIVDALSSPRKEEDKLEMYLRKDRNLNTQFMTTIEYLSQSLDDTRPVT